MVFFDNLIYLSGEARLFTIVPRCVRLRSSYGHNVNLPGSPGVDGSAYAVAVIRSAKGSMSLRCLAWTLHCRQGFSLMGFTTETSPVIRLVFCGTVSWISKSQLHNCSFQKVS